MANVGKKEYIIEVYTQAKLIFTDVTDATIKYIAQHKYPTLLAAYNAIADIKEMYADSNFYKIEIVDSEDLNRNYYSLDKYSTEKILDVELQQAIKKDVEIPTKVILVAEPKIKAAVEEYKAIGEHFDDIMDVAVDEDLPNWEREQIKLIRKHYAAECKEKTKFLRKFFAEIGIPKKALKISVKHDYSTRLDTVDYSIEILSKTEKIDTDQLDEIVDYFEDDNTTVNVLGFGYYGGFNDVFDEDDAEIKINILPN